MAEGRSARGGRSASPSPSPTPLLVSWTPGRLGAWPGRIAATAVIGSLRAASPRRGPCSSRPVRLGRADATPRTRRATGSTESSSRGRARRTTPICPRCSPLSRIAASRCACAPTARGPRCSRISWPSSSCRPSRVEVRTTPERYPAVTGLPDAASGVAATRGPRDGGRHRARVPHQRGFRGGRHSATCRASRAVCRGASLYVLEHDRSARASAGLQAAGCAVCAMRRGACSLHLPTIVRAVA